MLNTIQGVLRLKQSEHTSSGSPNDFPAKLSLLLITIFIIERAEELLTAGCVLTESRSRHKRSHSPLSHTHRNEPPRAPSSLLMKQLLFCCHNINYLIPGPGNEAPSTAALITLATRCHFKENTRALLVSKPRGLAGLTSRISEDASLRRGGEAKSKASETARHYPALSESQ